MWPRKPKKKLTSRQLQGQQAEVQALGWLQQQGLRLVQANYHCRFGEIDLIMWHAEVLVFVEVRYRTDRDYGGAAASVDYHKQQKIIRSAHNYLTRFAELPCCRFDVLLIEKNAPVEWINGAFDAF